MQVRLVTQQALPNVPGESLTAMLAYVLSGTVRSQLNGGSTRDYAVGQSWTEPPGTEHTLTANPSKTEPACLLAVFVAPTGAELTRPRR